MILTSCTYQTNHQKLKLDITSDTMLKLKKKAKQGNVWGIDLKIKGNFTDTVKLIQSNGKNVIYKHQLIGEYHSKYRIDWYSDSCIISFENVNKPVKNIEIEYEFLDMK